MLLHIFVCKPMSEHALRGPSPRLFPTSTTTTCPPLPSHSFLPHSYHQHFPPTTWSPFPHPSRAPVPPLTCARLSQPPPLRVLIILEINLWFNLEVAFYSISSSASFIAHCARLFQPPPFLVSCLPPSLPSPSPPYPSPLPPINSAKQVTRALVRAHTHTRARTHTHTHGAAARHRPASAAAGPHPVRFAGRLGGMVFGQI